MTDYGDDQPLLMDYYGFADELYQVIFNSRGDSNVSQLVVDTLAKSGITARKMSQTNPRGLDGRGLSENTEERRRALRGGSSASDGQIVIWADKT